jgi:nicotinate phosphoribosyltransferase
MIHEVRSIGTTAHEFIQAVSALESLNHPNRLAMQKWSEVYRGELGIALPDTFGTDAFLKDFDVYFAKMFDGARQDSGKPFEFADKFIAHYKKLGIDPLTKTLVFSDALNVKKAIEINEYCKGKIKASMGIGTFFSNDFEGSPALNMVIKLWTVNDFFVVKLSDDNGKENGEAKSLEMHKWLFGRN